MKRYIFHSDPSHGWLQVPVSELKALGIAGQISPYSYVSGQYAYLEEDCDAGVFLGAKTDAGSPLDWDQIGEVSYSYEAPMRSMRSYA
jgi:hypothetical protein